MEQFRNIEGYEGLYQVSNEGRVKSLNYRRSGEEHIIMPFTDSWGYLRIDLCKNGNCTHYLIHRLVASAFIPNHDNLPQVNHKDECKTNNFVFVNEDGSVDHEKSNLEWCDSSYNTNYGTRNERVVKANTNGKLSIPVDMLTKQGELIRSFPSSREAERWLRVNGFPKADQGHISECCKEKRKTHCGFKWQYTKKELPN